MARIRMTGSLKVGGSWDGLSRVGIVLAPVALVVVVSGVVLPSVAAMVVEAVVSMAVVSKSGGLYGTSSPYRTYASSLISTRWYFVSLARFETITLYSTSSRRTALIADEKKRVCCASTVECSSLEIRSLFPIPPWSFAATPCAVNGLKWVAFFMSCFFVASSVLRLSVIMSRYSL